MRDSFRSMNRAQVELSSLKKIFVTIWKCEKAKSNKVKRRNKITRLCIYDERDAIHHCKDVVDIRWESRDNWETHFLLSAQYLGKMKNARVRMMCRVIRKLPIPEMRVGDHYVRMNSSTLIPLTHSSPLHLIALPRLHYRDYIVCPLDPLV